MPEPVWEYQVTSHAHAQMLRRRIRIETLETVLRNPEQRFLSGANREVVQSRIEFAGKQYLVRAIIDVDTAPPEVVTVYRTSKIAKYWRISE